MASNTNKLPILIVEDDEDDKLLLELALKPFENALDLHFVVDGEKLMEYLHRIKESALDHPKLILLDLKMPKKDGRQALKEIKNDPELKHIPIVVWTTSSLEEEKCFCMEAGAEGYVTKPDKLADLRKAIQGIVKDWLQLPCHTQRKK